MNENQQKYFEHVVKVLDKRTVLEQLAEESSEEVSSEEMWHLMMVCLK